MTIPITVRVPVPTAAATATRPTATRPAITMGAPRAAVIDAAVQSRDQALSTSVATSNANMSSGAMVTGATAVTTAIIRTEPTDPGRGPSRGAMAMAMAVSGAAGQRRLSTDTNRPPIDMWSRGGRQRRFGAGPATKPILMATRIEMPANPGHTIQHCAEIMLKQKDRAG